MLPERYSVENFRRALNDPSLFIGETKRLVPSPRGFIHTTIGKRRLEAKHGPPLEVMNEDWDNLILLDACRYDIFEEQNGINGKLHQVVTAGSHSDEFMMANFHGKQLHDTVYITANPHADKTLNTGIFHDVLRTYGTTKFVDRPYDNHHPRIVVEKAIKAYSEYPNKRLIVHFMQPHTPYLGPIAEQVRDKLREQGLSFRFTEQKENYKNNKIYKSILQAARDGHVRHDDLRRCYVENLNLVLQEVEQLLGELDGKSVISADHGEMLGDPTPLGPFTRRQYSHPRNTYTSELRLVPWLIIDSDKRRQIETGSPVSQNKVNEQDVDVQLEALGYKT